MGRPKRNKKREMRDQKQPSSSSLEIINKEKTILKHRMESSKLLEFNELVSFPF